MSKPKQEQRQPVPEEARQREERPSLPTEVTVRAYPVSGGSVLANLTFNINDAFAIRGARLVQGKNGPFVSMPQRRIGEEYQDTVFPVTAEMHDRLNHVAVAAYEQALGEMSQRFKQNQQSQQTQQSAPAGPTMTM